MANPERGALGTAIAETGAASPAWPSHATGDIGLLICESSNETITLSTPAGFSEVSYSPLATGTVGDQAATRLAVFWNRATSNAMAAPTIADPGNHIIARIATITGCVETGLPWSIITGNTSSASSTVRLPGATTSDASCLVVGIVANPRDDSANQCSSWTNASLTSFSEWGNTQSFTPGNGGGFNIVTGLKASAGAYTTSEAVLAASMRQARMTIALKPPPPPTQPASPSSSTSQHPTKIYGNTGTYIVKLTVTDGTGLSSSTTASITAT